MAMTSEELYGDLWGKSILGFSEELERSLDPRGSDTLYDMFDPCSVGPGTVRIYTGGSDRRPWHQSPAAIVQSPHFDSRIHLAWPST
jgi:hypothetical protein